MPNRPARFSRDFQLFFGGQLLSNLGNSVTLFLLPLVVFVLTGSALNLGSPPLRSSSRTCSSV